MSKSNGSSPKSSDQSMTSAPSPIHSPLAMAKPRSLTEMFEAHPDEITDAEIDRMVIELRAQRQHFKVAKQQKVKSAPVPTGSVDEILNLIGLDKGIGKK